MSRQSFSSAMILLFLLISGCVSDDLFYDPELDMTMPELIRHYGYPVEEVNVTTKDGYILTHHRIPHGRDPRPAPNSNGVRPVVVFAHGLLSDSSNFAMNPPTSSAAYIFADAGFDVWLMNCRGSKYSLSHEFISKDDKAFWNFSWYEMGVRDLADTVDFILNMTGLDGVYLVGHSQGTTITFAALSDDPNGALGKKIRQFHGLGPNGGMEYNYNPWFQVLSRNPIYNALELLDAIVGGFDVVISEPLQEIAAKACLTPFLAKAIIDVLTIFPPLPERNGQANESRVDIYLKHFPGSTSLLNTVHWLQVIHFHELRKLDHGKDKNLQIYGTEEPPVLEFKNITTPTYLYYSDDDWIATAHDARNHIVDRYGPGLKGHTNLDHFTHMDYAIGLRAAEEIYRPIIRLIYDDLKERAVARILAERRPDSV